MTPMNFMKLKLSPRNKNDKIVMGMVFMASKAPTYPGLGEWDTAVL